MAIRFFDMFSGIGGFRSGLEAVGGFECIGHCEIDPYPNTAYNAIFEVNITVTTQEKSTPITYPTSTLSARDFLVRVIPKKQQIPK